MTVYRWLNRKDSQGKYLFNAGFLGMDNVSCVDRSDLPTDCTTIDQVTGSFYNSVCVVCTFTFLPYDMIRDGIFTCAQTADGRPA